jgi:hypothetical protein
LEMARRLLEQSEAIAREIGDTRGHPWRRMQWGRVWHGQKTARTKPVHSSGAPYAALAKSGADRRS